MSFSSIAIALTEDKAQMDFDLPGQVTGLTQVEVIPADSPAPPPRKILYSVTQDDYVWKNGPASFPRGTSYTVLEGDPYSAGPYTIRIKFPPNYKLPAHAHEDTEEVTVISGVLHIALGNELKEDAIELPAGGFTVISPNVDHYEWTGKEGAIVQFHGIAPRVSMYVDKKNDPTWKKQLQPANQVANNTIVPEQKTLATILKNAVVRTTRKSAIELSEQATKRPSKVQMVKSSKPKTVHALIKEIKTVSSQAAVKFAHHSNIILAKTHLANAVKQAKPGLKKQVTTSHKVDSVSSEKAKSYKKVSMNESTHKTVTMASKEKSIPESELLLN
jgi:hypothetical protein